MTLYRKYRPQTIDELDLGSVRDSLKKLSAKIDEIPHAFLFSGPKGSGKTSAARILAKIVNCEHPVKKDGYWEPCNKCDQCKAITSGQSMDVIEMDAASNRGIDDIRSLREHIALSPASAKKKIYILDEAHMLTLEASNAFLKTLEEPPEHVVFILATTDPHKLPDTVRSRLTNISFRKASSSEIARQLGRVSSGEELKLSDGVTNLIADYADGSFRDAVKVLEGLQLVGNEISLEQTKSFLFQGSSFSEKELITMLVNNQKNKALENISEFSQKGGSVKDLIDRALVYLRASMLKSQGIESGADEIGLPTEKIIELIKLFLEVRANISKTNIAELPLEILVINWCKDSPKKVKIPKKKAETQEVQVETPKKKEISAQSIENIDNEVWRKILENLREKSASTETLLRSAKPKDFSDHTLNVEVYYRFHKERLESHQCSQILEKVIREVTGKDAIKILYTLVDKPPMPKKEAFIPKTSLTKEVDNNIIEAAKEIFGG